MPVMAHDTQLFATDTVTVRDIRCAAPRGGCGAERGDEGAHIALVRRGAFAYHSGNRRHHADPTTALFHCARHAYRISHPVEGGDRCTIIACAPGLDEEVFGRDALEGRRVEFAVDPRSQFAHLALWRELACPGGDRMSSEELTLELIGLLRPLPVVPVRNASARRRFQRQLDDARMLLGDCLDRNVGVDVVARTVGLSPFHLMRSFRAYTGQTMRGYRRRLRVAAVLDRLDEGCEDLTRLALDVGFASHSHMDAAFGRELGLAPAAARERLAPSRRRAMRTFLQVPRPPSR
ncbi:helix-turn-helix domain-containing protein [Lysobacter sp. A421]